MVYVLIAFGVAALALAIVAGLRIAQGSGVLHAEVEKLEAEVIAKRRDAAQKAADAAEDLRLLREKILQPAPSFAKVPGGNYSFDASVGTFSPSPASDTTERGHGLKVGGGDVADAARVVSHGSISRNVREAYARDLLVLNASVAAELGRMPSEAQMKVASEMAKLLMQREDKSSPIEPSQSVDGIIFDEFGQVRIVRS